MLILHSKCCINVPISCVWPGTCRNIWNVPNLLSVGKWWVHSTRACNVLKMFSLVSRPPRPQWDGLGVAAVVVAFGDFFGGCSYGLARLDVSQNVWGTHKCLRRNQHYSRVPVCVSCPGDQPPILVDAIASKCEGTSVNWLEGSVSNEGTTRPHERVTCSIRWELVYPPDEGR